jgi:DNA-binding LytR/AlgR family response regulator
VILSRLFFIPEKPFANNNPSPTNNHPIPANNHLPVEKGMFHTNLVSTKLMGPVDKIIIIDNNEIQEELDKFINTNQKHILFNSDMDQLSTETNPILKGIIDNYEEKHKIKIRTKTRIWFFKSSEIIRLEAKKQNTILYLTNQNRSLINESIDQIENQLKDFSFIRIHDDHIVNVNFISKITAGWDESIELINGEIVPIENQRKQYILKSLENHNKL